MNTTAIASTESKPKRVIVTLLTLLFLFSYTVLITAVITQSKTIKSQRSLIHLLSKDNAHLSALRRNEIHQNAEKQSNAEIQVPAAMSPSIQIPTTQIPTTQVPSSKSGAQANAKTDRKTRKTLKPFPARPPAELTDPSDMRRVAFSI